MNAVTQRFNYLFRSTKGLILVAIALISLVTAAWGMLSGPLKEWGISDLAARLYGMQLVEAEREGRIIMLYHTIAMAVVAIETYLITALVPMKPEQQANINATITVGYIVSMVFGLAFGYFGHNFVFHGLFIFGQSLVFFAGVMLAAALWPWRKEYRVQDPAYAHTQGGVDMERVAFFVMAAATLGSALFGAVPGSLFGNGFEVFLAEDVIRIPAKTALQLAVIGHLHIMLTLIAVALTLIVGRWFDFKGKLHRWAMPLMIVGTLIITGGRVGSWCRSDDRAHDHQRRLHPGTVGIVAAGLLRLAQDRCASGWLRTASNAPRSGRSCRRCCTTRSSSARCGRWST